MIDLRMLGRIELDGGRDPDSLLGRPRDLALLAYLAATGNGGYIARDSVLAMFWPDSDERRARNALSQALHRIRRTTHPEIFATRGTRLRLEPTVVSTDVTRFRAAVDGSEWRQAVDIYGGDLLPGLHISGAPPFERWLDETRDRLRRAATEACRTLRDEAERVGDAAAAIGWAGRTIDLSSRSEGDVAHLIELHRSQGDRVAALRVYEDFRRWLRGELELEPSESMLALADAIRTEGATESPGHQVAKTMIGSSTRHTADAPPGPTTIARPRSRLKSASWLLAAAVTLPVAAGWTAWSALRSGGSRGSVGDPSASPSASAFEFYRRGLEYTADGWDAQNRRVRGANWDLAIEMFEKSVASDPVFAAAYGELGSGHLRLYHWGFDRTADRRDAAKVAIERSLALDPDVPEIHLSSAYYHLWGDRDYERALEWARRARQGLGDVPRVLTALAGATRRLGRVDEAIPLFERLVRADPQSAGWRWELVDSYLGSRDLRSAQRALEQAAALFPAHPRVHDYRWRLAVSRGDLAGARRVLSEASRRLEPDRLWDKEVELHLLERDYDGAVAVLERVQPDAFGTQQGYIPIGVLWGRVHRLAGNVAEARESYRSTLEELRDLVATNPDEPWYRHWLALALAGSGQRSEAWQEAARALDLLEEQPDDWENPHLLQALAHVYIVCEDYDRALSLIDWLRTRAYYRPMYDEALALDPRYDPLRRDPRFALRGTG